MMSALQSQQLVSRRRKGKPGTFSGLPAHLRPLYSVPSDEEKELNSIINDHQSDEEKQIPMKKVERKIPAFSSSQRSSTLGQVMMDLSDDKTKQSIKPPLYT